MTRLRGTVGRLLAGLPEPAACVLAVIIASAFYAGFFADWSFLRTVAGAAALGGTLALITSKLHFRWGLAAVTAVLAFLLYAVYVIFPDRTSNGLPGVDAVRAVAGGVLGGLANMLTVIPPADAEGVLIALPAFLAFAGAFAAVSLTYRSTVLLPLLPPLLVLIIALLLSAGVPRFEWALTLAFLGCTSLVALLRANTGSSTGGARLADTVPAVTADESAHSLGSRSSVAAVMFGVPVIVVVALLGVAGGGTLPLANGSARYDPREQRRPLVDIEDGLNPLVEVRRQLRAAETGPVELFSLRIASGAAVPARIRVAALDLYDGVQWKSSARFVRTGSSLPGGPALANPEQITLKVQLSGQMPGPYLPHVGRPVRVRAQDVAFDPASGQLVTAVKNLGGYSYEVTADVVPDSGLETAFPAGGVGFEPLVALPASVGSEFEELAADMSSTALTPYDKLQAIAVRLRSLPYDSAAVPGHSIAALSRFFPPDVAGDEQDDRVTEEQTVAAFVIMARALGYPARVAVGYDLPPGPAASGAYVVTTAQADAWPEVAFAGRGWVAFNATGSRSNAPATDPKPTSAGGSGDDPPLEVRPAAFGPDVEVDDEVSDSGPRAAALAWALPLVVLLGLALAVVAAKAMRRRHRSASGSTTDRVIGAWRESADRLRQHGFAVHAAMTPDEVASGTAARISDAAAEPVTELARIVSAALFAPVEPDESTVLSAWVLERELGAILTARRSVFVRVVTCLDPRPLLSSSRATHRFRLQELHLPRRGTA